ncbi:dihydroorotate dehydrogenase electron transfer subunit [Thiolapillus brandeum]|uniref:Dihydroorotate dehydrogenase electron transfer subunit n=1 Tax=Thiolapillus brandeum TaxID=1076588 RepID=A0A7U6GKZ0_9GAMM|nr:dihydroorotate dehydrogenase electron transfer subunit [Thiolapillus brandeum]BAO45507.1 dihydroorotate dehydrogenase electron transfer subunit [Thiolapillus brandeum]
MKHPEHRGSIFVEDAEILSQDAFPGKQYILRLQAPRCAARARPGQFVHLTVDPQRPMRRPISIMRAHPGEGWIDLLYKEVGEGTALLARRKAGEIISNLGPIGQPFQVSRKRPLLMGGGVGMPPMLFVAESLKDSDRQPLVILGSEVPFPFTPRPSEIMVPGIPDGIIATLPLLDDWGIACRLTSGQDMPGVHQGYVTDLARHWLNTLDDEAKNEVEVLACGPHPMLEAVVALAREFDLPVQVSLEEFMACGVGGCAGCAVEVQTENGPSMQRVCVDGPVFDGYRVF